MTIEFSWPERDDGVRVVQAMGQLFALYTFAVVSVILPALGFLIVQDLFAGTALTGDTLVARAIWWSLLTPNFAAVSYTILFVAGGLYTGDVKAWTSRTEVLFGFICITTFVLHVWIDVGWPAWM